MALAFPQFARDEGLVCAVDDDGDSLVCWDSFPWNPMTVYASQLERVEAAEPEGNNDEEPNDDPTPSTESAQVAEATDAPT